MASSSFKISYSRNVVLAHHFPRQHGDLPRDKNGDREGDRLESAI